MVCRDPVHNQITLYLSPDILTDLLGQTPAFQVYGVVVKFIVFAQDIDAVCLIDLHVPQGLFNDTGAVEPGHVQLILKFRNI